MKSVKKLLATFFAVILLLPACTSTGGLDPRFKPAVEKVSYYVVAKSVEYYVKSNPDHLDYVLEITDVLKTGGLTKDQAMIYMDLKLVKANVPDLEREVLSQALWDSVDFDALKLDVEKAAYVSNVGKYAELGARAAYSGSK